MMDKAKIKKIVKDTIKKRVIEHEEGFERNVDFSIGGNFTFEMAELGEDLTYFLANVAKAMGPQSVQINGTNYSLVYMRMLAAYLKANGESIANSEQYPEEVDAANELVSQAKTTFLIAKSAE